MLPQTLALVEDSADFASFLGRVLQEQGVAVRHFAQAADLLGLQGAEAFEFYVVDVAPPGHLELIRTLRRHTQAGVLALSRRADTESFRQVVRAGGDMLLAKPVNLEHLVLFVQAIHRRAAHTPTVPPWTLFRAQAVLQAPDGARIKLSATDVLVMGCLAAAQGEVVHRHTLVQALGRTAAGPGGDGLNAIFYRLRRRIERATPLLVPLQARSRVGYVFKAPLVQA
jgi:two-component system, OmpR family, response regulator